MDDVTVGDVQATSDAPSPGIARPTGTSRFDSSDEWIRVRDVPDGFRAVSEHDFYFSLSQ